MKTIIYAITLSVIAISCTPPLYIPNTTNTPTLKEKGDVDVSYSLGTNGHDLQGAYAITNNWGAMLNGSYGNSHSDSSANYNKHTFLEFGGGYTFNLNQDKTNTDRGIFSIFGGYGFGNSSGLYSYSFNDHVYSNQTTGNYSRIFIQPSVGYSNNNFDVFFTLRTSHVTVHEIKNELEQSLIDETYIDEFGDVVPFKNRNTFYEPTLTLRVGGEYVKGLLQLGFSKGLTPYYQTVFRQRPIIFIMGIHADLNVFK